MHINRVSRLTCHDTLPEEDIWVKLGGDKGGSCLRMHAQLCNVPMPNSPKNTSVFTAPCIHRSEPPHSSVSLSGPGALTVIPQVEVRFSP